MKWLALVVLVTAGAAAAPSVASAAGRVALVMGNSAYVEIGSTTRRGFRRPSRVWAST
ncbi:MAG: hypothetical protein OXF93_06750 [Acidobacteria bacterium]|nr:hypothetical protein [Acidobacteriota bacterium]